MIDELTPIAVYMTHEMNVNAHGADCQKMSALNAASSTACIKEYFNAPWWRKLFGTLSPQQCLDIEISSHTAALMMWALKVRQNAEWDHKPKIRAQFVSATTKTGTWHRYGGTEYFYDIWSNIHYGYVGSAAGFNENVLLDGAGLEQIGTDILRRRWPMHAPGVTGLRAFDDLSDRRAILIGIELFRVVPSHVAAYSLVQAILTSKDLATRSAVTP